MKKDSFISLLLKSHDMQLCSCLLTLCVSILSFSDIKLMEWWHFVLAFLSTFVSFLLFCLILVVIKVWIICCGRATLERDPVRVMKKLSTIIDEIYHKIDDYKTHDIEIQSILKMDIDILIENASMLLEKITSDARGELKEFQHIVNQELLDRYVRYIQKVKEGY